MILSLIDIVDGIDQELLSVSMVFLLLGGADDLLVDLLYFWFRITGVLSGTRRPPPKGPVPCARFAIFVPAWEESAVIGPMLRAMLDRWNGGGAFSIYVGTYPNDPDTIAAVRAIAADDPRVRLIVGSRPGPTTKADCLNVLWRALEQDAAQDGEACTAVVLHDAEDVVHPQELAVYATWIDQYGAVQLPVTPLRQPGSPLVSGHYIDEFVLSHALTLPVRQRLGASLPLAGVGCAIRCDVLQRIAMDRGVPFDPSSLTEDYELGLTLRAMGTPCVFVRVAEAESGAAVAVRAYFPATVSAAVRQKARWMAGIALAGWDRTGWGKPWDLCDHWMRMRDRRVTLAMPVLALAYAALLFWGASAALHRWTGIPQSSPGDWLRVGLAINMALLGWRLLMRVTLVGRLHGWREGLWSVPRMIVANYIGLLAARRALWIYIRLLAGGTVRWDKTAHQFPEIAPAAPPVAA